MCLVIKNGIIRRIPWNLPPALKLNKGGHAQLEIKILWLTQIYDLTYYTLSYNKNAGLTIESLNEI